MVDRAPTNKLPVSQQVSAVQLPRTMFGHGATMVQKPPPVWLFVACFVNLLCWLVLVKIKPALALSQHLLSLKPLSKKEECWPRVFVSFAGRRWLPGSAGLPCRSGRCACP